MDRQKDSSIAYCPQFTKIWDIMEDFSEIWDLWNELKTAIYHSNIFNFIIGRQWIT